MVNSNEANEGRWVEDRLSALDAASAFQSNIERARARLRDLEDAAPRRRGRTLMLVALACLVLAMLPWPRAIAQQFWDRVLLGRVVVVQGNGGDLPEHLTAPFTLEPRPFERKEVRDADEAEQLAGFRPALPPSGILEGTPTLSVVTTVTFATGPLNTADIERALAAAGVSDLQVPKAWEGTILVVEAGPVIIADYDGVEILQSGPFRMTTPSGFQFGRFMEIAFRVFGRSADEARRLGVTFAANPALVMHFPERETVRDVPLRSGGRGIFVGDPDGSDGICFFWHTPDRIYIVSAPR